MIYDLTTEQPAPRDSSFPGLVGLEPIAPGVLEEIRRWFAGYSSGFVRGVGASADIAKVIADHSRGVRRECLMLAQDLGLPPSARDLAEIVGLLHDVGLFEQPDVARSSFFKPDLHHDPDIQEHILDREGVLHPLPNPMQQIARQSILLHSASAPDPKGVDDTVQFYLHLLQDADTLDNWRIALREYEQINANKNPLLRHGLSDSPGYSLPVHDRIMAGHPVKPLDVRNLNDLRLLQVGWVFTLHFPESLRHTHTRNTIDSIRLSLNGCGNTEALFATAKDAVGGNKQTEATTRNEK